MTSQINKEKYKNAALYFINHCNNRYLGKTKLNKLFYYLDFISYRDTHQSVTGDKYLKDRLGPVPELLLDAIIPELRNEGSIDIKESEHEVNGETFPSYSFIPNKEPDLSVFSESEVILLKKICIEFKNWKSDKIVEQTHFEAPWFYSKQNEVIDFKYANDIDFFLED